MSSEFLKHVNLCSIDINKVSMIQTSIDIMVLSVYSKS